MPVLLLAQGDPQAKDLLRKAIQARYGIRPPALESLRVSFKGRVRARLGPIATWVPVEATAYFHFPRSMRWDFIVRAVGVQIGSGSEAFDGSTYRTLRGAKSPTEIADSALITSVQKRMWAMAAVLLTPLGDHFVKLSYHGERKFEACNTQTSGEVNLYMREDNAIERTEVSCVNPDNGREQVFTLRLSEEQQPINELMLPAKIEAYWDEDVYFEIEPVSAEANPPIAETVFRLEDE
ncbi:MAG: hypothetical protein JNJ61_10195 [Anaerolineae bacterium]|nr:hypothetical protein [Anaerolineae bacterium]